MAHAFTPGLKVTEHAVVKKTRRLPLLGEVTVDVGASVRAADVVARTELPGKVFPSNVANALGVLPEEVPSRMLRKEGETVEKGQVFAETPGIWGLFKGRVVSPIDGTVDSISKVTGQVMLREKPTPVEVSAYVDGTVTEILEREGVVVTTPATFIQGIFGLGGERQGEILVVSQSPDAVLEPGDFDGRCAGKIVVGGAFATLDALKAAFEVGAKGVIVGGFDYHDIKALLGYEVGVAITGGEQIPTTLIITEGFGHIAMAGRTHALLTAHQGDIASINGATQIRAGVIRPEVVIPHPEKSADGDGTEEIKGIEVGSLIRCIRHPYFGRIGTVSALPHALVKMASETEVRVLEVTFEDGESAVIPRANVELIEGA